MAEPPSSHRNAEPSPERFSPFRLGDVTADPASLTVEIGGRALVLTPTEWRLLNIFVAHAGQILTRDELGRGMWADGDHGNALQVAVSRLRGKLELYRRGRPQLIQTVRARGYRLDIAPLQDPGREP